MDGCAICGSPLCRNKAEHPIFLFTRRHHPVELRTDRKPDDALEDDLLELDARSSNCASSNPNYACAAFLSDASIEFPATTTRDGRYTAEAIARRREIAHLLRSMRGLARAGH
jgi:hypothetical protein